jgi:phage gp29-like protein
MPAGRPRNIVKDLQPEETRDKPVLAEIGKAVVSPFSLFDIDELYDESSVTLAELDRMIQTDGQAQSLYRILTMPIRAGELRVKPTDGGVNEAAFIHAQLVNPPELGGMTTPWAGVIQNIAKYILDGAEVLEKVHEVRNGHWVLRKLAPRPRNSIVINMDAKGGFAGVDQVLPSGTVHIPTHKCVLFVNGKEFNPLYGRSMMLPAYGHYEMKHKLYYISHLAYALNAIPIREGSIPPGAMDSERRAFQNALDNVGVNTSIIVPEGYGMEIHETRQVADSMPLIDHHDIEMGKAVLGQIINMGTTVSGGSYSLGQTQLEMLLLALQTLREDIAQVINSYVIPELIDWNFSSKRYPQLRLLPPATDMKALSKEVFQHISAARQVNTTAEFWLKLERKMAEMLGFEDEIDYDKKEAEMLASIEERQQAQSGVSQVKVAEKQADTAEKAQKDSAKIAEKQAATAEKVANKPTPPPVVAPVGARRQPTRPAQTRK